VTKGKAHCGPRVLVNGGYGAVFPFEGSSRNAPASKPFWRNGCEIGVFEMVEKGLAAFQIRRNICRSVARWMRPSGLVARRNLPMEGTRPILTEV